MEAQINWSDWCQQVSSNIWNNTIVQYALFSTYIKYQIQVYLYKKIYGSKYDKVEVKVQYRFYLILFTTKSVYDDFGLDRPNEYNMLGSQFQLEQTIYENIAMENSINENSENICQIKIIINLHIGMAILLAEYLHIEQFFKEDHNNNRQPVQHNHGITLRFSILSKRMFYYSISKVPFSLSHLSRILNLRTFLINRIRDNQFAQITLQTSKVILNLYENIIYKILQLEHA
uniref:Uncharacterized protein n=1 Tax=Spironucleus salmonicida TaxID=348837 RepID=V6LLR0_9EUKA|eukprot:EST45532.1 Hypothetical protein SS50377_14534 [Spironucleus salmonicida]